MLFGAGAKAVRVDEAWMALRRALQRRFRQLKWLGRTDSNTETVEQDGDLRDEMLEVWTVDCGITGWTCACRLPSPGPGNFVSRRLSQLGRRRPGRLWDGRRWEFERWVGGCVMTGSSLVTMDRWHAS